MPEIPVLVSSVMLSNYFFAAFILSYIAPKVRIGKMFWYGLVAFFFIVFFHNLEIVIVQNFPNFNYYILFAASFFLILSIGGLFYDRRTWLGGELKVTRTLLTPSEIRMMEKEKRENAVR